jgi:hypothetical protein
MGEMRLAKTLTAKLHSLFVRQQKALFGDVETHANSVLPQVETYVHRFGPGLVLYWFGHAPLSRLGDGHGDVAIVGGDLPDLFMLPTGALHGRGGKIDTTA